MLVIIIVSYSCWYKIEPLKHWMSCLGVSTFPSLEMFNVLMTFLAGSEKGTEALSKRLNWNFKFPSHVNTYGYFILLHFIIYIYLPRLSPSLEYFWLGQVAVNSSLLTLKDGTGRRGNEGRRGVWKETRPLRPAQYFQSVSLKKRLDKAWGLTLE